MVIRPHLHWFRMLLAWRGSVLPQLLPRLFLIFCISLVAVAVHAHLLKITVNLSTTPFSLVGIALAVFLGFRNNASYDRYWEARKLWGQLLNDARSMARQALTLPRGAEAAAVREFAQVLGALPHALRHQLRRTDPREDLSARLPAPVFERVMASRYRPAAIMLWLGEWVQRRAGEGEGSLDAWAVLAFDRNLGSLSNVIGGCERIVSTPLPFAYSVMIHRTVYFFCAALPFGLVESIGLFTPLFSVFVAYTFMAHEAIAAQIEEPFGTEDNDLALNAMSTMIEGAVRDMLGEPVPDDGTAASRVFILD
ncbi:bestrophin family protein [Ralstonia solanacearum]|nr:bestrophin family protein [Ralstonia solanacearum]